MMFMTYPDGTQEVHDGGLMIRVKRGAVVAGSLTLTHGGEAYGLDVKPGNDPRAIGYLWQKQASRKWSDQVKGRTSFLTESGEVWFPTRPAVIEEAEAS